MTKPESLNDRSPVRAVVFDMDGLMLNTEDVFDLAGRQLLARRGLEMTDIIRHSMLGRRPVDAFNALISHTGMTDRIEDLMHETKELFEEISENSLATMPGLHDVLELVELRNLPLAVATSSPRAYMTPLLERFDLLHRFNFTLTAEDVTHGKPHPEIYQLAARKLKVSPDRMLVLEDSETGTRAAHAAGAYIVSVPNRHTAIGDFSMSRLRIDSLLDQRLHDLLRQA
jgi:HAD superfamily hydrolase (TIGR01509 family)